ncbi:hypothetical protein CEXT_599261 [Caerostris extrusa]|uniref:Uncharacterized protein n=1 Tax=Caerostris extrusa TaxID=172846 RepID=A0AAV4SCU9_CAEEX|nr:hypothetical protein CEXT_599261 [Caerostris extrusa]
MYCNCFAKLSSSISFFQTQPVTKKKRRETTCSPPTVTVHSPAGWTGQPATKRQATIPANDHQSWGLLEACQEGQLVKRCARFPSSSHGGSGRLTNGCWRISLLFRCGFMVLFRGRDVQARIVSFFVGFSLKF